MTSRVDLHCHSTASEESRLGVQRSLGLPECATPPDEVYALARRRGMDFVTITDHDTIDGCLELADRPDCFISEELTARFAGEPQAVHILCYGITPGDHEWLQAHAGDVEACATYLHEGGIACALAHPFYDVAAPLTARHRRRLARLFEVWEVRNGSRAAELNMPAAIYIDTHGGVGIAGSDDHAGVDIGRTFTEAPAAATPEEFLAHLREGTVKACGQQGSAAKWAHAAMALATRALAFSGETVGGAPVDPAAVLRISERVIREGADREGAVNADVSPEDARALLDAWLDSVGLDLRGRELIAYLQQDGFSHEELYRRARRTGDRRMAEAISEGTEQFARGDLPGVLSGLFAALLPTIPYAPSATFLAREKTRISTREAGPVRVALVADGIGSMHGVTGTVEQIRERGVPGFDIDVIGTDPHVDRRLPSVAELDVPFYEGLTLGVPSLADLVETIGEGRYDLLHVTAPGPIGLGATLLARVSGMPLVASYHTELTAYAGLRANNEGLAMVAEAGVGAFYRAPLAVLSPGESSDESLIGMGVNPARLERWERGVDTERFTAGKADPEAYPGNVKVLYAGRLSTEKGIDLLADAFERARAADPRLHLLVAGGGPEEEALRERLGENATFLGWLGGEELPRLFASADMFLFASQTDTYGQVISEAGASGLPVVAVAAGGPAKLVEHGRTGLLCPPDADRLAEAVANLAGSPIRRHAMGAAGRAAAEERSWERALGQLGAGWRRGLALAGTGDQLSRVA